eukprot:15433925-Alexandrium_andersonii.AAC.1
MSSLIGSSSPIAHAGATPGHASRAPAAGQVVLGGVRLPGPICPGLVQRALEQDVGVAPHECGHL